jgi:hypothetical protein
MAILRRSGSAHDGSTAVDTAGNDTTRDDITGTDTRGNHAAGNDTRTTTTTAAPGPALDRKAVRRREKEEFGGVKIGSAFFGWLTATGMAVVLTALLAAIGTAVGVTTGTTVDGAATQATQATDTAKTVGLVGGIALLVVLFLAYYCGGYVAARMARFNGLRQGVAVWLWAVVIAVAVAIAAAIAGSKYDLLGSLNSFPRIPVGSGDLTRGGIIALVAIAVISLVGAMLGGLAGMRFHRRVDKAGLEGLDVYPR